MTAVPSQICVEMADSIGVMQVLAKYSTFSPGSTKKRRAVWYACVLLTVKWDKISFIVTHICVSAHNLYESRLSLYVLMCFFLFSNKYSHALTGQLLVFLSPGLMFCVLRREYITLIDSCQVERFYAMAGVS